jgi:hypothetical protein
MNAIIADWEAIAPALNGTIALRPTNMVASEIDSKTVGIEQRHCEQSKTPAGDSSAGVQAEAPSEAWGPPWPRQWP